MKSFIGKKHTLIFLGGMIGSKLIGSFLKTKTAHNAAVKVVASGIKAKNHASEKIENIKEDAQDLVEESKKALQEGEITIE